MLDVDLGDYHHKGFHKTISCVHQMAENNLILIVLVSDGPTIGSVSLISVMVSF